jgi:hypothetical protein
MTSLSSNWSRRSFLKAGIAASTLPILPRPATLHALRGPLPGVPTVGDLAGSRLVHAWRDLYQLPTTQNEYGYVQASKSVSGLTALSLPPFACCGIPEMMWSPGFLLTCELFLNGRTVLSYSPGGDTIAYQWFPHCFVRESEVDGLRFTTETIMPSQRRAVAQSIRVRNVGLATRTVTLGFDMRAAVSKRTTAWIVNSPGEADNSIHWDEKRGALLFQAQHSAAASVQGISAQPSRVAYGRMIVMDVTLGPGETREFHYLNAVDGTADAALAAYDQIQSGFQETMRQNEADFNRLLQAAFTEGNSDFSGYLPQLQTDDEALWQLYHAGFKNLIFARRASPDSKYGTTYITLGGHVLPTLSFPWDTSLTSLSLALLDPEALRRLIENWFVQDMHRHLATDYISGEGVGPWYGVNDMSIVRCAENYLRVTGDFTWLDKKIGEKTAIAHLFEHATYWKQLDKQAHGLGDYGKIENLLEVVSTYLHEIAGMNAGNVSSMRFVANLLEHRGESVRAAQLRSEATDLARRINQKLYVPGKGWWKCGQPDGSFFEVRHCYDFLSVLDNMASDLSQSQKEEMSRFFWDELHSEYWMRALSPNDVDATWNIRPDHSWLGAYAAWPPASAKGLYKIDRPERIAPWVKNLAKAGNQGPIGQAHFVETVFPLEDGAAYKCPNDPPYINDWCCIAGGGFADLVIDTIFGANPTLFEGLTARPQLKDFDGKARLVNLRHQDKRYTISANGASVVS